MRLFVAIDVPEAWRTALTEAQRAMPPDLARSLRFVEPHLVHLTLKFIGEVADERAPELLVPALDDAAAGCAVSFALGRAGTFGPPARTQVAWLGVDGDMDALRVLAARVDVAVATALDVPREARPLSPHLTLARVRRGATPEQRRAVAEAIEALAPPMSYPFTAQEVVLVRSHLGSGSPRYEVLSRHGRPPGGALRS
jgi:RNA 2',3'-cyclic 3'-phosphodiesterase